MSLYPPDVAERVEDHAQHMCERCGREVMHGPDGGPQPHYRPVRPRAWCVPRPARPDSRG